MASATNSQIDLYFRRVLIFSKVFTQSWGSFQSISLIKNFRDAVMSKGLCADLILQDTPKMIIESHEINDDIIEIDGKFKSPLANYMPEILPKESHTCYWKGYFPNNKNARKVVIHLAGTGDHTYFRRRLGFANGLLKKNIGSILIENPFYGKRKPKNQFMSSLPNVTDLFILGAALMTECNYLLMYARTNFGLDIQGISGVSMGGFTASLAASNIRYPISLVPCLSWTCASRSYTNGAISEAIKWDVLRKELDSTEFRRNLESIPNQEWLGELEEILKRDPEADRTKEFMKIFMREFTYLGNYPIIAEPKLCKVIVPQSDSYVIRENLPTFKDIWPGSEVIILPTDGHVRTYFQYHDIFRKHIEETLNDLEKNS
uniref:AB hydrolase-1 domain-containing protein n=1 Tax=Strongyloides papillosus TaxID=174720 RepID=A0A0N5BKY0_STREA